MIKILKKPLILVPLILVVVLIVGLIVFRKKQLPYEFVTVKKSDLVQEVSVTGRVKPAEDVNLAFEQGGKIKRVYAKVGDKVNTNQSLADLDMSELSAKLAQTQADLSGQYAQSRQYEAAKEAQQANLNEL